MLTDLLNTPALVNTQHNHWTVTCQIRAYPVHYTHIFLSRSLHFRHVLNPLFSLNVPPTPPHPQAHTHHTCSFSFFFILFFLAKSSIPAPPLLAVFCLIRTVSNVSVQPRGWGPAPSSSRKEGVCCGNWP